MSSTDDELRALGYEIPAKPALVHVDEIQALERDGRIDEVNKFSDWLTDNPDGNYLQYAHERIAALEAGS